MNWQPIETAPKDETILLSGLNYGKSDAGRHYVIGSSWHDGFVDRGAEDANRDIGNRLQYITHWCAIEPPKDTP